MKRKFLQALMFDRFGPARARAILSAAAVLGVVAASSLPARAEDAPAAPSPATQRASDKGGQPTTQSPRAQLSAPFERIRQAVGELKVSDEQKVKIESVLRGALTEFKAAASGLQDASPEDRADTIRDLQKAARDKVVALLDENQKAAFDAKLDTFRLNLAGRAGPMIERLQGAVDKLDLTAEQKTQAREVVKSAMEKMRQARADLGGDAQGVREKSRAVLEESRKSLSELLSPEQQQKLMELMRQPGEGNRPAGERRRKPDEPKSPAAAKDAPPMMDAPMTGEATMGGAMDGSMGAAGTTKPARATGATAAKPESAPPASATGALDPGKPAPTFTLTKLDGQAVQLSSFKNKVTVLVFGNYSAPTFRQRAADVDALRKELGSRANVFIVYTRESHPVGGWEVDRNKDEGVQIEQPADQETRVRTAKMARDALKITTTVVVDTIDDATATAYDGFTNSAVVIGRDGNIVTRQKWFEPYLLRRAVDDALSAKPTTRRAE